MAKKSKENKEHILKDHNLPISILQTRLQWGRTSFHMFLAGVKCRELALQITQDDSSL